ncbi:phosphate regulon sensor histidine kinase PhoR [Marinobacter sp. ANT_B65]|uniref:phosphate regulon sensor histidine kinase PhoR n=1 Tax=Marinobacter sp. ANT_B65 TaxID=2039467 RepID=UPI000BBE6177|nr:phosphate regulon sensor histidine kinase PhoR [Marinobacter sp. ANT_B65]PCM42963.1 phosphate regulon sensor histidine kinase PhoR [Marinobacter sp. ANT_B65]
MQHNWSRHLRYTLASLAGTTLAGLYLGYPLYGLISGLGAYMLWNLYQIHRLAQWLAAPNDTTEAPQSIGIWGILFEKLHKLNQNHLQTLDRLRARIDRIQESTNAMRDGVIMTNARGTMEWWNGSAEYLLGFRRNTDQGQYIFNLIRTPAFRSYFDAKNYHEPLEIHSPSRPHIHLQIQISLFGNDDRLIVAKDVTRLHQLEQMRRDFVSNVSHEMRTPLTVISGYLETLADNAGDLPAKWQRAINTMGTQSSRMEALITDLILLSRIETSEHTQSNTPTDIDCLVRQICQDARTLSGKKQHEITFEASGAHFLKGDEYQLRSAFSNLIFNAVKYTPAKGQVSVFWSTNSEGGHLSVKDSGSGIDEIHLPRLTERFYRADPSRHKDTGGTGLGLAIVKHALINHDGSLEIRSQLGKGSEFTCHFPADRLIEGPEK